MVIVRRTFGVCVVDAARDRLACGVGQSPAEPPPDETPDQPAPYSYLGEPSLQSLPPAPEVPPDAGAPTTIPQFLGRFALLYGMGIGTVVYVVGYALSFLTGQSQGQGYWAFAWLAIGFGISFVLMLVGIVLTVLARTRQFGAGLLISIAIGLIAGSGVCVALLSATSN